MATLLSGHQNWQPLSHDRDTVGLKDGLGLSISSFPTSQTQYLFVSEIGHADPSTTDDTKPAQPSLDAAVPNSSDHEVGVSDASLLTSFGNRPTYSSYPSFTALNDTDMKLQDSFTISPLKTRFDGGTPMFGSHNSFSPDGSIHSATYPTFGQWPDTVEQQSPTQKRRRHSTQGDPPYTTGRRRKSENVVPGSARAVYLEKNRKAASKCRTKQKKQQEDLVEAARDQERRNKVLKSEVEILKSDLRDLMEMVGAHNECPDTRLRRYVQQEADRLAAGDQSPIAELLSPKGSSYGSASASPETLP